MAGNRSRPRFVVGAGCCGAVCAGGRRPAREIATREPSARSRRSRSPARPCRRPPAPRPGSAGHAGLAVPSMREPAARSRRSRSPAKPSGTLHTGGAFHCCAHPIQASPPTGTAAKLHSQASLVPQLTRRPPHRRCLVCWWGNRRCFEARLCPAAAHGHRDGHQPAAVCLCWFPIWPAGGCSIRSWLAACRRRVAALMTRFPRFEAARLRFVVVRRSKCRPPR